MSGQSDNQQIEHLQQEIRQLRQDLVNQRQMWKMAIAFVLETPGLLPLIGNPDRDNEVREALRPVAALALSADVAPPHAGSTSGIDSIPPATTAIN